MFVVYALYATRYRKIYIGYTADLEARLMAHNLLAHKGWTIRYRPWTLIYTESFEDRLSAMTREKALKTAKGREFVWQQVKKLFEN